MKTKIFLLFSNGVVVKNLKNSEKYFLDVLQGPRTAEGTYNYQHSSTLLKVRDRCEREVLFSKLARKKPVGCNTRPLETRPKKLLVFFGFTRKSTKKKWNSKQNQNWNSFPKKPRESFQIAPWDRPENNYLQNPRKFQNKISTNIEIGQSSHKSSYQKTTL